MLNLHERILGLLQTRTDRPVEAPLLEESETAIRHIAEWKSQSPFQSEEWFARRLEIAGISEHEFLQILSPQEPLPHAEILKYLKARSTFLQSWASGNKHEALPASGVLEKFLHVAYPPIQQAVEHIVQHSKSVLATNPQAPFDPDTIVSLFYPLLATRLTSVISRVAVLELHVMRAQGLLRGKTPEERFENFIEHLSHPSKGLALFKEYPVLARITQDELELWVETSSEFIERLATDWDTLRTRFDPDSEPSHLEEIIVAGDRHRRGRAVIISRFSSGFKLVYKPKSLAIDVHFCNLLEWLNKRGAPDLRSPKVLDCDEYGWSEFIAFKACTSQEELQLFYKRQGAFLALLYSLEATDFHNENLIAAGDHPILIDLESLFRADFRIDRLDQSSVIAYKTLTSSVLHVGLLPERRWGEEEDLDGTEQSGLGGNANQLSLRKVPIWENAGTDEMKLGRKRLTLAAALNQPTLGDNTANPIEFTEALLEGFSSMYKLLLRHRNDLLSEEGPLTQFANDEVRVILRPTRLYAMLLKESFHPDLLRDAAARDRLFDRLWLGLEKSVCPEKFTAILPSEIEELWRGDIPFFFTTVNSRDLWMSGSRRLPSYFEKSGFESVLFRLSQMGENDFNRQSWLIRASLTTLSDIETSTAGYTISKDPDIAATRSQMLTAACAVGDHLERLAIQTERDVAWIGLRLIKGRHWALAPLGVDIYSGLAGISLFLAYLGKATDENKYTRLAKKAVESIRRQIKQDRGHIKSIGGFDGWGSLVFTWTHLAILWQEESFFLEAKEMLLKMDPLVRFDRNLDILSGSAGGLLAVLGLYRATGCDFALEVARRMGDRLVAKAQPTGEGCGWAVPVSPDQPLTGYSHGAAGIACALLDVYSASGEERFKKLYQDALAFENGTFLESQRNWPDLRKPLNGEVSQPRFMIAWCHGAPGIGLSRLRMMRLDDDPKLQRDLDTAIATTLRFGFGNNHSLCHGDLGNLELISLAAKKLNRPELIQERKRLATRILASIQEHGWLCGVPLGVETPGLLPGLAGIGYGLLRLADPDQVPAILLLDPPSRRSCPSGEQSQRDPQMGSCNLQGTGDPL
ncbi:MAG TPA: type 2 lanthipeptide synthetase LanM family protein [Thermoanaerobaculia bacterium]|nr:type 2 lanthipeptide synthetase LanM family protein [Thermoanaerobaculia bacterium]